MIGRLRTKYNKLFNKDRYILSIDYSEGHDYGCKIEGYADKKGNIYITKAEYIYPNDNTRKE